MRAPVRGFLSRRRLLNSVFLLKRDPTFSLCAYTRWEREATLWQILHRRARRASLSLKSS